MQFFADLYGSTIYARRFNDESQVAGDIFCAYVQRSYWLEHLHLLLFELSFSTYMYVHVTMPWCFVLGGIVGLWTGFSALAVAEIASLLVSLFLYCFGCVKGDIEKKENKVTIPGKAKMSKEKHYINNCLFVCTMYSPPPL